MASTSPNLLLKVWNNLSDLFNHTELEENWDKIDAHDHTTGKGVPIPTGGIANLAITGPKLATDSVDGSKIATGAVGTLELADAIITAAKIDATLAAYLGIATGGVTHRGYNQILTTETTVSTTTSGVDLATPGPSVTIAVPSNALVFAFAQVQASVSSSGQTAIVNLQEDGSPVSLAPGRILESTTLGSVNPMYPNGDNGLTGGNHGTIERHQAQLLTFPATAGTHTYKLVYRSSSGTSTATFLNRKLWVWSQGF